MKPRIHVEPSLSATVTVREMPEGEWLDEDQIAAIPQVEETLTKTGRTVRSALGEARRRGWVIRDNQGQRSRYSRTPSGGRATSSSPK